MRIAMLIIAISLFPLSVCFGTSPKSGIQEYSLDRNRKEAIDELRKIFPKNYAKSSISSETYDSIYGVLKTYGKLEQANEENELSLISEFDAYYNKLPQSIPLSQKSVDTINELRRQVNTLIDDRRERFRKAAEQREKERPNREAAEAARLKFVEDAEIARQEAINREEKKRIEKENQERRYNEKIFKAREAALIAPDYFKQSVVCQVCGNVEEKRKLEAYFRKKKPYEAKYGVVNLTEREHAIAMDMVYDSQIAEGMGKYKDRFKETFSLSACKKFDADKCQSTLEAIEEKFIAECLAGNQ